MNSYANFQPLKKQLQVLESSKLKSTMKSRKAELAITKLMRDQFEKNEKIALPSSKVYQNVHRQKKIQIHLAAERAAKGAGDMYVDSDRRIAVGMGMSEIYRVTFNNPHDEVDLNKINFDRSGRFERAG